MASKKDKLGPLKNRIKEMNSLDLESRRMKLAERIAMDNREIGAINNELKGRAK